MKTVRLTAKGKTYRNEAVASLEKAVRYMEEACERLSLVQGIGAEKVIEATRVEIEEYNEAKREISSLR